MNDGLWRLRKGGEAFLEEVSEEYHAAHAGLKTAAVLQPIYEKHRDSYGDDAIDRALRYRGWIDGAVRALQKTSS